VRHELGDVVEGQAQEAVILSGLLIGVFRFQGYGPREGRENLREVNRGDQASRCDFAKRVTPLAVLDRGREGTINARRTGERE
jgi:hypothetical protein